MWLENVLSCMSFKVVFWSKHCDICWTELKEIIETFVTIIISLIIALKILMSGVRTIRTICSRLLVTSLTKQELSPINFPPYKIVQNLV